METFVIIIIVGGFIYLKFKSTPYQPKNFFGGYSETQLAVDMYRVKFNGNGNTKTDRTIDFCMLRCAELTLEKGYKYFYIIDSNTGTDGQIINRQHVYIPSHPTSNNTITMLKEKPANDNTLYDAAFIVPSYKAKYHIKK